MTNEEQQAFVKAYSNHVGYITDAEVVEFISCHQTLEDDMHINDYNESLWDALGVWKEAIKWQREQTREALTLSLSELYRHATDSDSGEKAIEAVEKVLK